MPSGKSLLARPVRFSRSRHISNSGKTIHRVRISTVGARLAAVRQATARPVALRGPRQSSGGAAPDGRRALTLRREWTRHQRRQQRTITDMFSLSTVAQLGADAARSAAATAARLPTKHRSVFWAM